MKIITEKNISPFSKKEFNKGFKQIASGYDFEYQTTLEEFKVFHDTDNDLLFLKTIPQVQEMSKIYPSNYYANSDKSNSFVSFFRDFIELRKFKYLFKLIDTKDKIKILDLGSGDGRLLMLLKKYIKCECYGIEFSTEGVVKSKKMDIKVIEGNVENIEMKEWNNKFHIIIMHQLIEHTRFPDELLKKCNAWLVDQGIISIETPQFNGLDYMLFKNRNKSMSK